MRIKVTLLLNKYNIFTVYYIQLTIEINPITKISITKSKCNFRLNTCINS